jgi:hypothetical protein
MSMRKYKSSGDRIPTVAHLLLKQPWANEIPPRISRLVKSIEALESGEVRLIGINSLAIGSVSAATWHKIVESDMLPEPGVEWQYSEFDGTDRIGIIEAGKADGKVKRSVLAKCPECQKYFEVLHGGKSSHGSYSRRIPARGWDCCSNACKKGLLEKITKGHRVIEQVANEYKNSMVINLKYEDQEI